MTKENKNDDGGTGLTAGDAVSVSVPTQELPHVELNLNDYVWVRLRDPGRAILREQDVSWSRLFATSYGRLPTAEKQASENAGWSRWQLWSLIECFGSALFLGCDPPFETTIRLQAPVVSATDSSHAERSASPHRSAAPGTSPTSVTEPPA